MGDLRVNIELIQHRNPGTLSDWRLRLHHGARDLDEESPRITDHDLRALRAARRYPDFEARVRQTDWADFWAWLSPEAREELFRMITGLEE